MRRAGRGIAIGILRRRLRSRWPGQYAPAFLIARLDMQLHREGVVIHSIWHIDHWHQHNPLELAHLFSAARLSSMASANLPSFRAFLISFLSLSETIALPPPHVCASLLIISFAHFAYHTSCSHISQLQLQFRKRRNVKIDGKKEIPTSFSAHLPHFPQPVHYPTS